jgi:hypothetical protein
MSYAQWRAHIFLVFTYNYHACIGGFTQVSLVQLRGVSFQSVCSFAIV